LLLSKLQARPSTNTEHDLIRLDNEIQQLRTDISNLNEEISQHSASHNKTSEDLLRSPEAANSPNKRIDSIPVSTEARRNPESNGTKRESPRDKKVTQKEKLSAPSSSSSSVSGRSKEKEGLAPVSISGSSPSGSSDHQPEKSVEKKGEPETAADGAVIAPAVESSQTETSDHQPEQRGTRNRSAASTGKSASALPGKSPPEEPSAHRASEQPGKDAQSSNTAKQLAPIPTSKPLPEDMPQNVAEHAE
jgi:hypothetical protein